MKTLIGWAAVGLLLLAAGMQSQASDAPRDGVRKGARGALHHGGAARGRGGGVEISPFAFLDFGPGDCGYFWIRRNGVPQEVYRCY